MVTFVQNIQKKPLVQFMFDFNFVLLLKFNQKENNNHDDSSFCFHKHNQCYLCQFHEVATKMVIICKNI